MAQILAPPRASTPPDAPASRPAASYRAKPKVRGISREDLARLAPDDPIIARELARLTRPAPRPDWIAAVPMSPAELLPKPVEIRDPTIVVRAVDGLLRYLGDSGGFWSAHSQVIKAAWEEPSRRPRDYQCPWLADGVAHAYRKAMGPKARNWGAIYKLELDRWMRESGWNVNRGR